MRLYPVYPMVKELLDRYRVVTVSDCRHKRGDELIASLAVNKKELWAGLRVAKSLGYPYK